MIEPQKYKASFYDGEEWLTIDNAEFNTPEEAKLFGIECGYEYVRVVKA